MKAAEKQHLYASLQEELDAAYLYTTLAGLEKDQRLSQVYLRMAKVEQQHAETIQQRLKDASEPIPALQPGWRPRCMMWLARRFGASFVLPSIVSMEQRGSRSYQETPATAEMARQENFHASLLKQIAHTTRGGVEGGILAQYEGRHRSAGGNALRAAVLGANDGLVSNLSLVMGVAGAELSSSAILVTGLAGLLAGACSMALGEWLSVQSSRELYTHQIAIEKAEIEVAPQEEAEELALIYEARGLDPQQARSLADSVMSDSENALHTLVREELKIDPEELGGSAWEAALTSFILFSMGAIVPVLPFLFTSGLPAVALSIFWSTLGLFTIGAGTSLFTGRGLLFSGLRMVIFGLAAAALTFIIGRLIGVNISG